MSFDIETIGWTKNDKFFIVKIDHEFRPWDDDIRGLCGVFNCQKFAKMYWGCAFVSKFALINGQDVYVNPAALEDCSIDECYVKMTLSEFELLRDRDESKN